MNLSHLWRLAPRSTLSQEWENPEDGNKLIDNDKLIQAQPHRAKMYRDGASTLRNYTLPLTFSTITAKQNIKNYSWPELRHCGQSSIKNAMDMLNGEFTHSWLLPDPRTEKLLGFQFADGGLDYTQVIWTDFWDWDKYTDDLEPLYNRISHAIEGSF